MWAWSLPPCEATPTGALPVVGNRWYLYTPPRTVKRSELLFDAVRLPVDFVALVAAGLLAYGIRVSPLVRGIRPILFAVELPLGEYLGLVVSVSAVTLAIFAALGLYVMEATRRMVDEVTRIAAGVTLAAFGIIFWMFIRAELFNSRFLLLAAWFFGILFVVVGRSLVRRVQIRLLKRGRGVHRVVLVGRSPVADGLRTLFGTRPDLGYRVVGQMQPVEREELERLREQYGVDMVIRCDPVLPPKDIWTLLDFCEDNKIDFAYVPDLYETRIGNVLMRTLGGYPLVELRRTSLEGWGRIWKRLTDLLGSVIVLLVLTPLFGLITLAITANSRGPVFFRQTRVGRNRQPFRIVKFRTMVENAEALKSSLLPYNEREGPLFKMTDDPRVTRVGRFLRRWRLDEFPQLFNVLRGEMSLIGPRPHLPEEIAWYEKSYRKLFAIKPGMTGLAQVSGSSRLPLEEEVALDVRYIEHWSPRLDLFIFAKTLRRLFRDRSAV